jgi:hypothetical protein
MYFQQLLHRATPAIIGLAVALTAAQNAAAQDAACPLSGQKPTLVVQMFFGQSIRNRGPVTKKEWDAFLRSTVTPHFPDGFTVYDGYGQWMNPDTRIVARENSKVIVIATEDMPEVRDGINDVAAVYRKRFHQQAVGVLTNPGCIAFASD